jgi:hypothetical protein
LFTSAARNFARSSGRNLVVLRLSLIAFLRVSVLILCKQAVPELFHGFARGLVASEAKRRGAAAMRAGVAAKEALHTECDVVDDEVYMGCPILVSIF